jgi:hypothetical protein
MYVVAGGLVMALVRTLFCRQFPLPKQVLFLAALAKMAARLIGVAHSTTPGVIALALSSSPSDAPSQAPSTDHPSGIL